MERLHFGVSQGLRGYYAIVYDATTGEPIQTGIGSYDNEREAAVEAAEWAEAEHWSLEAEQLRLKYKL